MLALWAEKKKAVLFITHDLDEAIALSDRVVVLSAGPASHPIGEFAIDLPRPRDVAEVRVTPRFVELHQAIWAVLREEVLAGYRQQNAPHRRKPHLQLLHTCSPCWPAALLWHLLTTPGLLPNFMFENDRQAAFFFGEPLKIFGRIWAWFVANADIYEHLWVTLVETVLAFAIGTVLGLVFGLWLALSDFAAKLLIRISRRSTPCRA